MGAPRLDAKGNPVIDDLPFREEHRFWPKGHRAWKFFDDHHVMVLCVEAAYKEAKRQAVEYSRKHNTQLTVYP